MACVWVGDVYSVDHHEHLVECASPHGDIGLRSVGTSGAHV